MAILALVLYLPSATASKCLEFESLDEILKHATNANVLVKVNKEFASGDDETQYTDLCNMYENTSEERKEAVVIGKVEGDLHKELAKDLSAENEDSWATYVLIKKGTKKVTLYNGEKKSEAIAGYLKKETGATIGTFVYSLGLLDAMAARFVKIKDDDKNAKIQKKIIANASTYLSYVITIRADKNTKSVVGMYLKTFSKSIENGDNYASKQSERIKKLMEKDNSMSIKKREEMSQKLHILSKFTDPVELTPEQQRQFYISIGLNVFMLIALFFLAIQMIMGGGGGDWQVYGEVEVTKETSEGAADKDNKKDD
jgi:hypothetical protein